MSLKTGFRVFGQPAVLHSGAGRLLGYLVSHNQAGARAVTFYDSPSAAGRVLHKVHVAPERSPVYVRFADGKDAGLPFSAGLAVDPGDCDVAVWSIGYAAH